MKYILLIATLIFVGCGKDGAAGPAGPAGAPGQTGAQGPAGSDGTDNRIVATINCDGQISGLAGAAGTALNGLWVEYNAALTASGDVYAAANVSAPSFQVGDSIYYAASQNGSATGSVIFTADFATSNYGWWNVSLNRSTLVVTAVYNDTDLGGQSPVTMNFNASACQSASY